MISCIITYDIDPFAGEAFAHYARGWNTAIPRCGADLIGYFAPHEGSATTAFGLYSLPDLAAYEQYRTRLRTDEQARDNFAFAKREGFIRREDRLFVRRVDQ